MSLLRHEADDYEREGANDKFAEATSKILEIWNSDDAEREVGFLNFLTETINAIERTGAEIAPEVIAESDPDDEDGEISFWYATGCVRANTRIFEVLNAFVLKYESKPLPKSKKKLIRLLLNIDANAGRDALQKLYPNLVERWLKFGDTFKKVPVVFASEPKWVIESQQALDAYYFAEAGIKPFWVRRSDITNALDQLTPDERADLEIVAKALTASNLDAAREALETISAKYPDVGVHWILDRLGSHTPKAV